MLNYLIASLSDSLGWVGIAASPTGLVALTLSDSESQVETQLHTQLAPTPLAAHSVELLSQAVDTLQAWLTNPAQSLSGLPLDLDTLASTAFQQQVWRTLQAIPCGQTLSYQALAHAIGQPRASRAVARACATNRLAVIIPCHRIIRSDGGLGGYRWDIARKHWLLGHESAAAMDEYPTN